MNGLRQLSLLTPDYKGTHHQRRKQPNDVKRFTLEDGTHDPALRYVGDKFMRLRWGAYIHARAGRHRHHYRKRGVIKNKLGEHIFSNEKDSWCLDRLSNEEMRKPRFYPEDIYEPYQRRWGTTLDYVNSKKKMYP